jgi:hypothetical protein
MDRPVLLNSFFDLLAGDPWWAAARGTAAPIIGPSAIGSAIRDPSPAKRKLARECDARTTAKAGTARRSGLASRNCVHLARSSSRPASNE